MDVLINNAGDAKKDSVIDVNLSEFDRIFETNLRSVINLTKLCIPHLEKTNGNIVNTSSYFGIRTCANFLSYSMSKAALNQFTKCSALDLAPKGIRVNAINPSHIRTNVFESLGFSKERFEAGIKATGKKYPVGRAGEVTDTSAAIIFLADNDKASFLTGVLLTVDGGALIAGV